jgi:hypothetical protein
MYTNPKGAESSAPSQQTDANKPEKYSREVDAVSLDILNPVLTYSVDVTRTLPVVVGSINSEGNGENYIEYSSVRVSGSEIHYRMQGATLNNKKSCIFPRLVFWGETGDYLGEAAPRQEISGKFEIILSWPLPQNTASVTPRITFNQDCLVQAEGIAICSADLTVSP